MTAFLMFTLDAPLASMGDVAVGERRYGSDRPAKSAVLGLVAGALGIERIDEDTHRNLAESYGYAVRSTTASRTLVDYHTVEAPAARKGRHWATRRDELADPKELGTTVTLRDYKTEVSAHVALWERTGSAPRFALEGLASALRTPAFTLYFGRKGCPLGRPPFPRIHDVPTLAEAFRQYAAAKKDAKGPDEPRLDGPIHADVEIRGQLGEACREDRIVTRRDALVSRRRWQFGVREELVATYAPPSEDRDGDGR